ncbi:MAG TPA: hypothetical protein VMN79_10255 [Casimicrobiaceae bacterium]|nr:hypothetical protein [Casimicrobiaceae bacterium]
MRLLGLAAFSVFVLASPGSARADIASAIEYYDAALDHYFVTSLPAEIAALDGGQFPGWVRTGLSFDVYEAGSAVPGSVPVCRFYGTPAAGLDSHFYSASALECAEVQQRFPTAWLLESGDVFEVFLPDTTTGACPAGSIPIYRAWNQRSDSNHRYTTDLAVLQAMVAKGYAAEGYGPGPAPTAMCSPTGSTGGAAPACTPTATDGFPLVGTTITVSANCTGNPTGYAWGGCISTDASCTATSSLAGTLTYTVVASNAGGTSAPASIAVSWQPLPPPPACSVIVTANSVPPVAGSLALLDAVCTNAPTSYAWLNCGSKTSECGAVASAAGVQTYTVTARNAGGTSPGASATVDWQSAMPPPPGFCGAFASYLYSDDGWIATRLISSAFTDDPGFASNGVWVARLTVPSGAASANQGSVTIAEYGSPPTPRQATISLSPCDFRAVDPTGASGPLAVSNGNTARILFRLGAPASGVAGLSPGQTYYVNLRNWDATTSSPSCDPSLDRCDAFMDISLP